MIKEALKQLNNNQRELLQYAFETDISQYIVYDSVNFVGVNVMETNNMIIEERIGVWVKGQIKQ